MLEKRKDVKFQQKRAQRLADLTKQIAPLKADRMKHHAAIHRLRFEEVIAADGDAKKARRAREQAEAELAELQAEIAPLQQEINQLGRQFWVSKDQVKASNYDLSASRYRQLEQDEAFYEKPEVTLERMRQLGDTAASVLTEIQGMLT
jgi:type I restriction enzyme M protein